MLNYEWINKEAHEELTMLFLHEALGSIGQWKDFPSRICLELNLPGLIYERKGHGRSPALGKKRTSRYLHEYALDELPHFLTEIERKFGSRKWILIGHSDGGSIALLYAAQFPEKIHSIVTMAAHVVNEPETIAGIQPAVDAFKQVKLDGLRKYHGERTSDLFYAWADTWKSEFFANWNICNDIRSIQAPVLAIQ